MLLIVDKETHLYRCWGYNCNSWARLPHSWLYRDRSYERAKIWHTLYVCRLLLDLLIISLHIILYNFHFFFLVSAVGCPYSEVNLNRESFLQDRLSGERPLPAFSILKPRRPGTPNPTADTQPDCPQSR